MEAVDLRKAFAGRSVLKGVTFAVRRGEACAIIGPSGEGKSTLLRCLNLLVLINAGEVRLDGKLVVKVSDGRPPVIGMDPTALRRRVGMVFQEWNLWPNMTARENIALALRSVRGMSRRQAGEVAAEYGRRVRITEKLDAYPQSLSGGQKQRVAIARALAMEPDILMLDEVTSALDPVLAAEVLDVMTEVKGDGRTLLLVTHHMDFARSIANQVLFLHEGRVAEAGPPEILDAPQSDELKWFLHRNRRGR